MPKEISVPPDLTHFRFVTAVFEKAVTEGLMRGVPVTEEQPDGTRKVIGHVLSVSPDPNGTGTLMVESSIDPNSETAKKLAKEQPHPGDDGFGIWMVDKL